MSCRNCDCARCREVNGPRPHPDTVPMPAPMIPVCTCGGAWPAITPWLPWLPCPMHGPQPILPIGYPYTYGAGTITLTTTTTPEIQ